MGAWSQFQAMRGTLPVLNTLWSYSGINQLLKTLTNWGATRQLYCLLTILHTPGINQLCNRKRERQTEGMMDKGFLWGQGDTKLSASYQGFSWILLDRQKLIAGPWITLQLGSTIRIPVYFRLKRTFFMSKDSVCLFVTVIAQEGSVPERRWMLVQHVNTLYLYHLPTECNIINYYT